MGAVPTDESKKSFVPGLWHVNRNAKLYQAEGAPAGPLLRPIGYCFVWGGRCRTWTESLCTQLPMVQQLLP
eukprot:4850071-Amphidinium_carterae.1